MGRNRRGTCNQNVRKKNIFNKRKIKMFVKDIQVRDEMKNIQLFSSKRMQIMCQVRKAISH